MKKLKIILLMRTIGWCQRAIFWSNMKEACTIPPQLWAAMVQRHPEAALQYLLMKNQIIGSYLKAWDKEQRSHDHPRYHWLLTRLSECNKHMDSICPSIDAILNQIKF